MSQLPIRIETDALTKRFVPQDTTALDRVDWTVPAGVAVGLIGSNGAGKSTLLRCVAGFMVPTRGSCMTLGVPADRLSDAQLARIGYVDQEAALLGWMTVDQHIRYVAALQPRWDRELERRLSREFDLEPKQRVQALSTGMRQRLAVLLGVCHRPELLLLDEPVSALDPIARDQVLQLLLELVIDDGTSVVISSHGLHDLEKIVDRVLCLQHGQVVEDASVDELKDSYAEWIVTTQQDALPTTFEEPYVLKQQGSGRQARLTVRAGESDLAAFRSRYGATVESHGLDLERIFPLLSHGKIARRGVTQ